MINEVMYGLGSKSSVIRELFSYGLERKKVVGADKVYDFSLGNPSIPAPHQVKDAIAKLLEEPAEVLHGYSLSTLPIIQVALSILKRRSRSWQMSFAEKKKSMDMPFI